MTNEELIQEYRNNPDNTDTLHQLYQQSIGLIKKLAKECAENFHCVFYTDDGRKTYTTYTINVIEELVGEGIVALGEVIAGGQYDPEKAALSTYVYPFIKGAMLRWLETNVGIVALSRHNMQKIRQVQKLYYEDCYTTEEICREMNLSQAKVSQLLSYNTHPISVEQLMEEGSLSPEEFVPLGDMYQPVESVERIVMQSIYLSLLPDLFDQLKMKDKHILGHFYGVYDYEKKSPDRLALELELTIEGVYKARDAAIHHLQDLYRNSPMYIWRKTYYATKRTAERGMYHSSVCQRIPVFV